ncbi:MAG: hypothetical protein PF495_10530 [Spirochaetales bacterium]|jgi:hypothetical protein|nr:hypothetical protein [Spirochaetales bacterium]
MKTKLLSIALLSSLLLSTHAQDEVYSNIVGMYKVPKIEGGLQLLGVSLGKNTTLSQLIDLDKFKGDVFTINADQLISYNAQTQSYVTYAKYDDSEYVQDSTIAWRLFTDFTGENLDPVLPPGSAVFIRAVEGDADDIIVAGDVPLSENTTIEIVAGLQMMAAPYTAKIDLNSNAGFIESGATGSVFTIDADQIITWDSDTQSYVTYALYDESAYVAENPVVEWRLFTNFNQSPAQPIEIDVGSGFWYRAQNEFSWVAINPYFDNL